MTSLRCPKTFAKASGVSLPAPSRHDHALDVYRQGDLAFAGHVDVWIDLERARGWQSDAAATQAFVEQAMRIAAALKARGSLAEAVAALPPTEGLDRAWRPAPGLFLRCDVVSANWSALRLLDPTLPETFEAYALDNGAEPFFAASKAFRQYAIGNTWPRKLARMQAEDTRAVMHVMLARYPSVETGLGLVGATHDEFVFSTSRWRLGRGVADLEAACRVQGVKLPRRVEVFECSQLGLQLPDDTERAVGWLLEIRTPKPNGELSEPRRETFAVHGRLAVAAHRQVVLGQPPEPADFLYEDEGLLCSVLGTP